MQVACQYAIVQFLPFLETGEFANVGVLVVSPKNGYWDFKLAPVIFPRVTNFFGELDRKVYQNAVRGFGDELHELQSLSSNLRGDTLLSFTKEVTRSRESLLRFSEMRTILASDPAHCLAELFERFVNRDFVTREYRERTMAATIRDKLKPYKLDKQYKQRTLEAKLRKITLPLVNANNEDGKIYSAMKPLAFDQREASKIIDHGEQWKNKIQWLLNNNVLTEDKLLIPIEAPDQKGESSDLTEAFQIVKEDLQTLGGGVVSFDNMQLITTFARESLQFDGLH